MRSGAAALLGGLMLCAAALADRHAVLSQIQVPHHYYYREMYLPQVTSSPGSLAFMPDGRSLVYSMQGSLWKQSLDSDTAVQLTGSGGYDYQPDVSRDGTRVVFTRYLNDAMELQLLDLRSGAVTPITSGGAVNTEPRFSPDGTRIAWVSTAGTGHFHVFVGTLNGNHLEGGAVWPERRSKVVRYYYSAFDHEISPSWSPDGKELIYVSNPESIYGTGGIWRRGLERNAEPHLVRAEETTWRARPDWSSDGKRVAWASYAGRNSHQIWLTTAAGNGDPLALTYGDAEATGARWSLDATRIAYLSNETGDEQIHVVEVPGARSQTVLVRKRQYLHPMGELQLRITGPGLGKGSAEGELAARVSVIASDGRAYAPDDAWMRADDGFDRSVQAFETHYFHSAGHSTLTLPTGPAKITVWRGLVTAVAHTEVTIKAGAATPLQVSLQPLALPAGWRDNWHSADVHVHMNYAGTYRDNPQRLVAQATAEDLDVVFDLVVNKEQRIPDIGYFSPEPDPATTSSVLLSHGQEYHTSYWGHLGLLGLNDHFLLPGFAAYTNTAAASLYPTNAAIADLAHAQSALVGYVHPFDAPPPDPQHDESLTSELPVDVALGKVDYYEVVGFSDHQASATVWHRLLNCGFRPSAAGGTDAMANYASMRGPVGLARVFVDDGDAPRGTTPADRHARLDRWLHALKAGQSLATNSALLGLTVDGKSPGSDISLAAGGASVHVKGFMRSIVPMDHLQLMSQGKVLLEIPLHGDRRSADVDEQIKVPAPGWVLLRAWNEQASPDVFDIYPYASTNPVFFSSPGAAVHCGADADYFIAWTDRLADAARVHPDFNTTVERQATLDQIAAARKVFEQRR
ncbi:MAG: CehA/McbA family metallohydrolase [Steroidobacteraceae bacterium]